VARRQGDSPVTDRRARVVAVVQARMSSARLPGKVLATLGEQTVLELLLRRLARARELDEIVVATSTEPSDDPVEREAERLSVRVVRGSLIDALGRFLEASAATGADAIVRITADCPLMDPDVVDLVVRAWRDSGADYATNTLEPRSYPDGLDVEVISAGALRRAGELARSPFDREHVTPYVRHHPETFSTEGVHLDPPHGEVRMTLDTPADLEALRRLVDEVGPDATMNDVLKALGWT
jgi:spore coat polysaccharide biosynthesis protein SpsF (cytidylyltransferase family)